MWKHWDHLPGFSKKISPTYDPKFNHFCEFLSPYDVWWIKTWISLEHHFSACHTRVSRQWVWWQGAGGDVENGGLKWRGCDHNPLTQDLEEIGQPWLTASSIPKLAFTMGYLEFKLSCCLPNSWLSWLDAIVIYVFTWLKEVFLDLQFHHLCRSAVFWINCWSLPQAVSMLWRFLESGLENRVI